jgi:AcrR family transcriptional regulator
MRAARDLATECGFRNLTVDDVCARAGLSKGAFYVHSPSEQALLDREISQVDRQLDPSTVGELPGLEKIRAFVRTMVQRAQDPASATPAQFSVGTRRHRQLAARASNVFGCGCRSTARHCPSAIRMRRSAVGVGAEGARQGRCREGRS